MKRCYHICKRGNFNVDQVTAQIFTLFQDQTPEFRANILIIMKADLKLK
jgi:hypothetical protein